MLPPPSLLDRLLGNLPAFLSIWAIFLFSVLLWLTETGAVLFTPFGAGFVALWAWDSRSRVVAGQRWQREKDEVLGKGARRTPRALRLATGALYIGLALPALFIAWHMGSGFLKGAYGLDVKAWFAPLQTAVEAADRDTLLAGAGIVAVVFLGLLWRRRRSARVVRAKPRRGRAGEWDGTVKVLLPVPKDEP